MNNVLLCWYLAFPAIKEYIFTTAYLNFAQNTITVAQTLQISKILPIVHFRELSDDLPETGNSFE